jgi:hypothetical protein
LGTEALINFFVSGNWQGEAKEQLTVAVDSSQLFLFDSTNGWRLD